jgi:cysteine desulfurase / selenocysteine lyase
LNSPPSASPRCRRPYGTGFLWTRPDLLRSLHATQAYWLAQMTAADLGREEAEVRLPTGPPTARTFDVFGTANFFNFKPWAAAVEYLLGVGIERVAAHDQQLVQAIHDGLDAAAQSAGVEPPLDARLPLPQGP